MKNINKYINVLFISLGLFGALQLTSCKEDAVRTYDSTVNSLWFERNGEYDSDKMIRNRVDTTEISATFFPGIETYTHKFKVNLIGNLLTSSKEYKVIAVGSMTDVEALKYIQVEKNPIFKAGVVSDSIDVVFSFKDIPTGFRGRVVYELAESDYFQLGFIGYHRIILWINNIPSKPLWWEAEIETVYLGEYSEKKFEEFVRATGVTSLEFANAFERRKVCLEFKEYVIKNNIMDEDSNGNKFPMEIPIY